MSRTFCDVPEQPSKEHKLVRPFLAMRSCEIVVGLVKILEDYFFTMNFLRYMCEPLHLLATLAATCKYALPLNLASNAATCHHASLKVV